jgi:hypothetical protein
LSSLPTLPSIGYTNSTNSIMYPDNEDKLKDEPCATPTAVRHNEKLEATLSCGTSVPAGDRDLACMDLAYRLKRPRNHTVHAPGHDAA